MTKAELYNKIVLHIEMLSKETSYWQAKYSTESKGISFCYKEINKIGKAISAIEKIGASESIELNNHLKDLKLTSKRHGQFYIAFYYQYIKLDLERRLYDAIKSYLMNDIFLKLPIKDKIHLSRKEAINAIRAFGACLENSYGEKDYEWDPNIEITEQKILNEIEKIDENYVEKIMHLHTNKVPLVKKKSLQKSKSYKDSEITIIALIQEFLEGKAKACNMKLTDYCNSLDKGPKGGLLSKQLIDESFQYINSKMTKETTIDYVRKELGSIVRKKLKKNKY